MATANVQKTSNEAVGADVMEARATVSGLEISASKAVRLIAGGSVSAPRFVVVAPTTPVTASAAQDVVLILQRADGTPISNALVNFTTTFGIGKPSKPTDLTDAAGTIRMPLMAVSSTSSGADELVVTATVDGAQIRATANFRVNATAIGQIKLELRDRNGLPIDTVSSGNPATVLATLTNESNAGVPNVVLSFSSLLGLGGFSAPTALTNSLGVATVQLRPATSQTVGADTVVVRGTLNGAALSATQGFQLTATNVTIASVGTIPALPSVLSAYGQGEITVNLAGTSPTEPVTVLLTSTCIGEGKATLTPPSVTTTTGVARFTYRDNGCGAVRTQDSLQVTVSGTTATSSVALGLSSPSVSAINFTSATPSTIFVKGSGFVENSTVRFQVKDANGNGLPGRCAALELTTTAGGILLEDDTAPVRRKSDANGDFFVRINSGTVPTPVRVRATLVDGGSATDCSGGTLTNIATVSSNLSVAVGLPSQLNFSLAQQTINIEGYDRDGTSNVYTVTASDRVGNPVPDGTSVNFVAESGQVEAIRFTAGSGGLSRTSANYVSAEPRPRDGRVTIVAYALGEKSFLDTNGNNTFNAGEPFQDLGDVFLDRLFNASYSASAPYNVFTGGHNVTDDQIFSLTLPGSSLQACQTTTSPLMSLNVSIPSLNTGARCTKDMNAYVRRAAQTVLSTSSANPVWGTSLPSGSYAAVCPSPVTLLGSGYNDDDTPITTDVYRLGSVSIYRKGGRIGTISFLASDSNPIAFNPVAAGTIISATATTGLTVQVAGGSPVPSSSRPTGVVINYAFDEAQLSGTITINLRSPSGLSTAIPIDVSWGDSSPSGLVPCP